MRVGDDFAEEYPDGDASATEAYLTIARAGQALLDELNRAIEASLGVSDSVMNCLAVIDGAGEPLTPRQISERSFRSSATMTGILDSLELNGWVRRIPNPADRRSLLVEITDEGRSVTDQVLPGVRKIEKAVIGSLTKAERATLLKLLGKVLEQATEVAAVDPIPLEGRRNRPARLA